VQDEFIDRHGAQATVRDPPGEFLSNHARAAENQNFHECFPPPARVGALPLPQPDASLPRLSQSLQVVSMTEVSIDELTEIISLRGRAGRSISAFAGPPGSGKSTVVESIAEALSATEPGSAAILPMDGYHFDDIVLRERGLRAVKGAPQTFDTGGLLAMLDRLARNDETEIAVPVFDRSLEIARAAARIIPSGVRHVLVEGNYLLLQTGGWERMRRFFQTTVLLHVPEVELRRRLEHRWMDLSETDRFAKLHNNDLPNGRLVYQGSAEPDFILKN
jgi:pantothenate kinase